MFDAHRIDASSLAAQPHEVATQADERPDALTRSGPGPMPPVHAAIRHAMLAPGKRHCPFFFFLIGDEGPGTLDAACTVEMVHATSLILDDLPCMDDAKLRRGRPTTHRANGEAGAVLARVSPIAQAFEVLPALPVAARTRASLATKLVKSIGRDGTGQDRDLAAEAAGVGHVERVNALKTLGLFTTAARMWAILGSRNPDQTAATDLFGWHVGCAFQIVDETLGGRATPCQASKDVGADTGRATLTRGIGQSAAWAIRLRHMLRARAALHRSGPNEAALCRFTPVADAACAR